ncbi:MAG TPA: hypothetical protein VJK52_02950, partial [Candidatus Nanoarchaeia archaeon]|nr:hypothetical protein [Candidatus Nanoarchaeia archaeon]
MRGAGWVFGSVSALPIVFGVPNVLRTFTEITQSTQAVTAISFLLFFMLLYAVIIAPLARIKIFKGDHGVTKPGKIAAVAIALLATVGIFYGYGGKAPAALFNILAPFGVFGGLVLALVIFLLIFMGFRESGTGSAFPIALTTAALAMILAGALLSEPNISAIGWIIAGIAVIVFLIMMVISAMRGSATSSQAAGSPPAPSAPVQSPVPRQSIPGRRSTVP